jgi:glycosyltransferase involved in cell wall biosynthesis
VLKKYPRLSETFILDEILELESAGIDVSVFSLRYPDEARFHADLASVRGTVSYLPPFGSASVLDAFGLLGTLGSSGGARLSRALQFVHRLPAERRTGVLLQGIHLAEAARRLRLDHLHAHFMTVAAHTTYVAHVLTGIPFSVTSHAKDIYRHTVDAEVFREVARSAGTLVTVCHANRRFMAERLLDAGTPVEVIHNGVRLDRLPSHGLPRRPHLVLAVGRLVEKKGYDILLRACRIMAEAGVPFDCILAGDGEERDHLMADRARLGLQERVRLPGAASRDQIFAWMREARVLVAPCVVARDGNRDALPTVILEALGLGLPVVATPVGGIPEIIESGKEGLLVAPGDPEALSGAIQHLLGDEMLWDSMSAAGPRKAAARFDRTRNTRSLLEIFRRGAVRTKRAPALTARTGR